MVAKSILLLGIGLWCGSIQAKQMAVVVDKSNGMVEITSADLAKILSFDTKEWKDGRKVILVLRDPSSTEVQDILQTVLKLPEDKVRALLATHKGAFVVARSDEDLVNYVAANPGAIGLVYVYSITSKVSVLKVDRKLPLEPGYLFH